MATRIRKNPPAKRLINSLRAIGYNFSTSVADIIDNSISAKAKRIDILTDTFVESPYVEILDNGIGMTMDELENALVFGSEREYDSDDLGRFGLGLKAASIAQCRRFLVCTKRGNNIYCMGYDLDVIEQTDDWDIICFDEKEIESIPNIDRLKVYESGTMVMWETFDYIKNESKQGKYEENLRSNISDAKKHVALVFHRFYDEIDICFDDTKVDKRDPFLLNSKPRQQTGITLREIVYGSEIVITPHSLPFANTLTLEEKALLGLENGRSIYDDQGFYIYRNRRLIIWGSWLKMNAKSEFNKLARVQVDVPTSLDSVWMLDVKKSQAKIPEVIKSKLKIALQDSIIKSQRAIRRPGKVEKESKNKIWVRREFGKEEVSYEINKDNPLYSKIISMLPADAIPFFNSYMYEVEKNLPKFIIRDDMEENIKIRNKSSEGIDEVEEELLEILYRTDKNDRIMLLDYFIQLDSFAVLKPRYSDIRKKVSDYE